MKTKEVLEKQQQERARLFMEKVAELLIAAQHKPNKGGSKMPSEAIKTIKRQILTLDHSIMQTIGKYGHINVLGLVKLMPEQRPKNTIYQRTRGLVEWNYIEAVMDKRKNKIFRLTQRGVEELAMRGVTVRGRSRLQCDLARVAWALEQTGYIETLGLDAQPATIPLDAVHKGDSPRVLIVDNPYQHIANTFQRLDDLVRAASSNAPLDIVALTEQRAAELQRYVSTNGYGFTVLLQLIDI
ncbi:hypothetical protein SAMN03159341_11742 [Paenibacillus sp. 1_12]|uniref:hypothetical protein n=1 Tax=Paenibacillus sp. 1_12 TaxID=1566278 RepID=UPI0008DF4F9E|nr:hypothetical protein [Paenibacillus sp. 1_12]SFM12366.1 hypothetical protein SAMN03159341_11742 [Paenibacillus sp. 1_12]